MRAKIIILFLFLLTAGFVSAQDIAVADFYLDEMDLAANSHGTTVFDQNGNKCALIKVETTQTGFNFDVGVLGITKTEQHTAEIWVYVPAGVKRMTISHQQLGILRDYNFPVQIERAKTYVMKLTTGTVQTVVKEAKTSQYVVFNVTPPDAMIFLDDQMLEVVDGTATKLVKFGTYDYRVERGNYHTKEGRVTVKDPNNKELVEVQLDPAFGWINIGGTAEMRGATVYIDNNRVGTVPMKSAELPSGNHSIRIVKNQYKPFNQDVTVTDGNTTNVTAALEADFANVTFTVKDGAEIWVNNELKGTGSWEGNLTSGEYFVQCKKAGHETSEKTYTITPDMTGQTIELIAPVPIYGSIDVNVLPAMADIYLDGKKVGQTPQTLEDVLIGSHKVEVRKNNYNTLSKSVTVVKDETASVTGRLESNNSEQQQPRVQNNTPAVQPQSRPVVERNPKKSEESYIKESCFYLQPTFQAGASMAVGGAIGAYISNVNIEGYYLMGLSKSEEIWWNATSETSERPFSYTYKPTSFGAKVGYGLTFGTQLRVTPQVGVGVLSINGTGDKGKSQGYATTASAGVKVDYAVTSFLSLNIAPEYDIAISKSGNFSQLSEVSSTIKKWASGFNCRIGISLFF